jgi:hypothetical protein
MVESSEQEIHSPEQSDFSQVVPNAIHTVHLSYVGKAVRKRWVGLEIRVVVYLKLISL